MGGLAIFWNLSPIALYLYQASLIPFLLQREVFPSQETMGRDVGLWFPLGGPPAALVVAITGPILRLFGTAGTRMLGGRNQYELEGYTACFITVAAFYLVVPLLVHVAGTCSGSRSAKTARSDELL